MENNNIDNIERNGKNFLMTKVFNTIFLFIYSGILISYSISFYNSQLKTKSIKAISKNNLEVISLKKEIKRSNLLKSLNLKLNFEGNKKVAKKSRKTKIKKVVSIEKVKSKKTNRTYLLKKRFEPVDEIIKQFKNLPVDQRRVELKEETISEKVWPKRKKVKLKNEYTRKKFNIEDTKFSSLKTRKITLKKNKTDNEQKHSHLLKSKNIINHYGFKKIVHKKVSFASLLDSNNLNEELTKLARQEKEENEKVVASKNKTRKDSEIKIDNKEFKRVSERSIAMENSKEEDDEMIFLDYSVDKEIENKDNKILTTQKIISSEETKNENEYSPRSNDKNLVNLANESKIKKAVVDNSNDKDQVVISSVVNSVIAREMANSNKKIKLAYHASTQKRSKPKLIHVNTQRTKKILPSPEYSKRDKSHDFNNKNKNVDMINKIFAGNEKLDSHLTSSKTVISLIEAGLNSQNRDQITHYEFASSHNMNERISDDGTGFINLEINLGNKQSIYRGTILKRGMMRTTVNLVVEPGTMNMELPIFSQEEITYLLAEKKIEGVGGFLLIELDEQIDKVDIDAKYDGKIYLSENFKELEAASDAYYILYLGVNPGNTLLKVQTNNNLYAEKVIHILEDEVLIESPLILEPEKQSLIVMERNILSKETNDLEVFDTEISYFNRKIYASKEASNLYSMKLPALVVGMRKYFEFNHLGETIYLGTWDKEKVEIPSRAFIENVMTNVEIEDLKGRCLIQLNLQKELKEFNYSGDTIKGPMNIHHHYLDKDGTMSDEISELAEKIYLVGDMQGLVNIELKYMDNTAEYLQSFCSEETYLVEHL